VLRVSLAIPGNCTGTSVVDKGFGAGDTAEKDGVGKQETLLQTV